MEGFGISLHISSIQRFFQAERNGQGREEGTDLHCIMGIGPLSRSEQHAEKGKQEGLESSLEEECKGGEKSGLTNRRSHYSRSNMVF